MFHILAFQISFKAFSNWDLKWPVGQSNFVPNFYTFITFGLLNYLFEHKKKYQIGLNTSKFLPNVQIRLLSQIERLEKELILNLKFEIYLFWSK